MKKLLPVLLLFACPAWGATALEIKHCTSSTQTSVTTATWTSQTGSACTFDRSGEAGTKAFIILANVNSANTTASTRSYFRLLQNISGTHDGGDNQATVLTDSGAAFPTTNGGLVGYGIYNSTDDSYCIATANTATTITCAHGLEKGTDDDWDDSDAYEIAVSYPEMNMSGPGGTPGEGAEDEGQSGDAAPGSNGVGRYGSVIRRISLDNSSHVFTWQGSNHVAADTMNIEVSSIVILEMSANMEYAELYSVENWDSDITLTSFSFVDSLALSFTATAEVWITLFSVDFIYEDESDNGCDSPEFAREASHSTPDTIYHLADLCTNIGPNNDNGGFSVSGLGIETLTAATHRFVVHMDGGGGTGADDVLISRASIVSFPVSDFENVYFDCDGPSGDCASNTNSAHSSTYGDTLADLDAQAITASKTHLALYSWGVTNVLATNRGSVRLHMDGDTYIQRNPDDRQGTSNWIGFSAIGKVTSGTTGTFKIEGISNSAVNDATVVEASVVVLEIPSGAAASRRRMTVITGAQ